MKLFIAFAFTTCLVAGTTNTTIAQTPNVPTLATAATVVSNVATDRVTFMLKNTLGYHRMFRVEGPGIAYGFTMNKRETVPCNWPVGSKLYFSNDGETTKGLILTVSAADAGTTLTTGNETTDKTRDDKPALEATVDKITFVLHSTSLIPRKVTLISYEPGATGNGTTGFMIGPKGNKRFSFPAGTKLYIANSDQVDVVMSGKRIDAGKPFMVVKREDSGKVIDLQ
ncbi:hypothetical protein [Fibrella aquatica]|uniref:hypothetical protein n=1 Tax=Fibrella aquatica TaxID=3242487 RepID=UPI0035222432